MNQVAQFKPELILVLLPPGWVLVHCRVTSSIKFPVAMYSWVERGTMRVKCLAQEHNTMLLKSGLLDPETSTV